MKKLITRFIFNIQRKARKKSLLEAVDRAKKITTETGKKVLIYFVRGEYVVMTKQEMKQKWKDKYFVGYTIQQVESFAELKITSMNKPKDKKLTPEEIKKLQEETEKKKGKTVRK